MAFENSLFDEMLDALGGDVDQVSLHTADPGGDGSNEVSGGDYARRSLTWDSADGGSVSAAEAADFEVPGSTTVTHLGFWAGSTWRGAIELAEPESFGGAGQLSADPVTVSLNN